MIKIFDESEQKVMTTREVKKKYPNRGFILTQSEDVYNSKGTLLDVKGKLYAIADENGLKELLNKSKEVQETDPVIMIVISPICDISGEGFDEENEVDGI